MRRLIFLNIIILFFEIQGRAQTYFHTPDSHAIWYISGTGILRISGDSSINGKIYHILECTYSNFMTAKYAYREDTNKKVYLVDFINNSNTEHEIYDFSSAVGDSVHTYFTGGTFATTIASIDSILINGTYRKKWVLNDFSNSPGCTGCRLTPTFWIEGIGSNLGFIYASYIGDSEYIPVLVCFEQNNLLLYKALPNWNCLDLYAGITSNKEEQSFSVFPTVVSKEINISFQESLNENVNVIIYNSLGVKIYSQSFYFSDHSNFPINISDLTQGLYFLSVTDHDGKVGVSKFVKE